MSPNPHPIGASRRRSALGAAATVSIALLLGFILLVDGHARTTRTVPAGSEGSSKLDRATDAGGIRPVVLSPGQELARVGPLRPGWVASVHTLRSGGRVRSYLVVSPHGGKYPVGALPLYVALHGRGANPAVMERLSSLTSVTGPAVLVYPAGYEDSWNAGGCCGRAHAARVDDVAFVRAVVAQVLARYRAASARRVYVAGFSNGGRMAYRLACDLPGTFEGLATVEAVPVFDCTHLRPLDVEIIAQRRDPLLTLSAGAKPKEVGGYVEPTVAATVARWRSLDGCTRAATLRRVGNAVAETWACRDRTRLQYTLYDAGGHVWPEARAGQESAGEVITSLFAPPATAPAAARNHRRLA